MRKISSTTVTANNEWLVWARKSANYNKEEIAEKMNVDPDVIDEWENTGNISYDDLVLIANHYKRPPTMFFNVNNPVYTRRVPDLRTIQSKKSHKETPKMSFEFREAEIKRQNLLNLEEELEDFEIPYFTFINVQSRDTYEIAKLVRDEIRMNAFRRKREKLTYWIDQVEKLGVLVFQFYGIEPEYMRGYALYHDKLPIIGINNKEHENGQKFTLFHELAHLIIKKDGFSDLNNYFLPNNEKKCNQIAAEILVPTKDLSWKMDFLRNKKDLDKIILKLSNEFKVSKEVIVRRLLNNGYLKHEYYLNKKEWDNYIAQRKRNPVTRDTTPTQEEDIEEIDLGEDNTYELNEDEDQEEDYNYQKYLGKATEALRKNGRFYTKSVVEAYNENVIQIDDVLNFLDIPLDVFYALDQKLVLEEES